MPGGLPNKLHYNSDRASLELTADDKNCPVHAHGFFELKINSQGEVTKAKDVNRSQSVDLKALAVGWVRNLLMQNSEQFVRVMAGKLLTYGLGRGVEDQDMPLVRSIVRDAAGGNYRFSTLVLGVVKSAPFQNNIKGGE
jgi:hypothetical protein